MRRRLTAGAGICEKTRMVRLVPGIALALALCLGCVRPRPIAAGDAPTLAPGEGILVVDVESDVPIQRLALSGFVAAERLEAGHHLALLVVGAGSYRWTAIQVPGAFGSVRFRIRREDEWAFRVEPGRINYAGQIFVRRHGSGIGPLFARNLNRSAMAWLELGRRHPELVERYAMHYSGPAEDAFFAELEALRAAGRAAGEAGSAE